MSCENILIVEDDQGLADVLSDILKLQGYAVEHAKNGKLAIDYTKNHNYDYIITDMKMPNGNGMDLIKYLVKKEIKSKVVIYSGFNDFQLNDSEKNKVLKFIKKPTSIISIVNLIRSDLENTKIAHC